MERSLEQELVRWKSLDEHLPILLRGARQVGKSFLVERFGETHFEDVVKVDFEQSPELCDAFNSRKPKEILSQLELLLNRPIRPGHALLFLDEIQLCPQALIALRYFKEQMPDLHVIAAGSLLEFILNEEDFSFPVGRVEFLYLRPLSFREYMRAAAPLIEERLKQYTLQNGPTPAEHAELIKWVRRYLFIGGMPASIKASLKEESLFETQRVHHRILQAYQSDFGKYGKRTQHKYLQVMFQNAPAVVSQVLKFSKIDPEIRSRELKGALELLCHAGLLQQVFATSASGLPLHAHIQEHRVKVFYLDVGLLQTMTKVDASHFFKTDIAQINAGVLAEQLISQELLAYSEPYQNLPLLFWERTDAGSAEVDFLTSVGSWVIPIDVKAGATGSLRSLHSFLKEKKQAPLGVRISEHPLAVHENILSIPFYLVSELQRLVREAVRQD